MFTLFPCGEATLCVLDRQKFRLVMSFGLPDLSLRRELCVKTFLLLNCLSRF